MESNEITLAILAGGAGSRMGRPKAELRVNGRPILEHLIERFAWPGPTLLVTAPGRENPPGAEAFDREAVDPAAGEGPLRGVLTALEGSATPFVLAAAVDMPALASVHLRELVESLRSHDGTLGLFPARLSDGRRQVEPFPGIFHVDAADVLRRRLAGGRRAVRDLVGEERFVSTDVSWEPSAWLNLNHPSDLTDLSRLGLRVR